MILPETYVMINYYYGGCISGIKSSNISCLSLSTSIKNKLIKVKIFKNKLVIIPNMDIIYCKFLCDGIYYVLGDDGRVYTNRKKDNVYQNLVGYMDYDKGLKVAWLDEYEGKHKSNKRNNNTGVVVLKSKSITSHHKRKPCENNWAEMIVCIILLYPELKTKINILSIKDKIKQDERFKCSGGNDNIDKYFEDIKLRGEIQIKEYIDHFDGTPFYSFNTIILTGKNFKDFPEIEKHPYHYKKDSKVIKSDIFLIYEGGIKGISVKASKACTLTNFSFENLCDKDKQTTLKDKRIKMLKDHFGGDNYKYTKEHRPEANKLFYDKKNEYFKEIISIIQENNPIFTETLLSFVFPSLEYDIYGYNGKSLIDLNKLSLKIKETKPKEIKREVKYESDGAAKLWFSLYLDNCEKWKFCIRGKNDLWKGSMQILEFTKVD